MSIVVLGSTNIDVTAYAGRLPAPGETVHASNYTLTLGGKGANQAVAAAQLGADVHLAGRTGDDAFGTLARDELKRFGASTDWLFCDPDHPTGIALIGVDAHGENSITVAGGANMAIGDEDITRLDPLLSKAEMLLLQLEIPLPTALAAARKVRAHGGFVILDPAPAPDAPFADDVWTSVDCMTPNETETAAIVGIRPVDHASAAKAASAMRERGLANAVVKMGADGLYWKSADGEGYLPIFRVDAIDTVAAGDCFNGGLAFALSRGDALPDALRFASACGALATTKRGAAASAPSLKEVEALMKSAKA